MAWDWLRENVGGATDWLTGGRTDFDQRGSSGGGLWGDQVNPWFGGSDNKWGPETDWVDKGNAFVEAFRKSGAISGSPTAAGSSFLSSQTKPAATAVTGASGSTGTLGDDTVIFNPPPFVALKDNPDPPSSGGSSSGGSGNKLLSAASTALGVAKLFGLCDIRTKTDISSLEITEVNDDLAQLAFFVKGIRECS